MKTAYLDSSFLLGIAFSETGAALLERRLEAFERLHSSNLLEAEVRSAFAREGIDLPEAVFVSVIWTLPDRPLTSELQRVLSFGYQKGADLWHLACALYLSEDPKQMAFLTLDTRQKRIAARLGFSV